MRRVIISFGRAFFVALTTMFAFSASAQQIEQVIVYIECTAPQNVPNPGQIVRGSGVIVSREGHVLTAKHVAPADYTCRGGIGTATIQPIRSLLHDSRQVHIDATLLKFVPVGDEQFPFLRYHPIEASLRRKPITAHGFPASRGVGVGAVYSTQGIIAQTTTNTQGIFGTDALQSGGMSGGPVVLNSDGSLVGIIVGATFGADGAPASYGVLAASEVATPLGLSPINQTPINQPSRAPDARRDGIVIPPTVNELHGTVEVVEFISGRPTGRPARHDEVIVYLFPVEGGRMQEESAPTQDGGRWRIRIQGREDGALEVMLVVTHVDDEGRRNDPGRRYWTPPIETIRLKPSDETYPLQIFERGAFIAEMAKRARLHEEALRRSAGAPLCLRPGNTLTIDGFVQCRRRNAGWFSATEPRVGRTDLYFSEAFSAAADDPAMLEQLALPLAFEGMRFLSQVGLPCDAMRRSADLFSRFKDDRLLARSLHRSIEPAVGCLRAGGPPPETDARDLLTELGGTNQEAIVTLLVNWLRRFVPDPASVSDANERLRFRQALSTAFQQYEASGTGRILATSIAVRRILESDRLYRSLEEVDSLYLRAWCALPDSPAALERRADAVQAVLERLSALGCRSPTQTQRLADAELAR